MASNSRGRGPASSRLRNRGSAKVAWLAFVVAAVAVLVLAVLYASVLEHRREGQLVTAPRKPVGEYESDNAKWGENFPREYASYKLMSDDETATKYGGAHPRDYLEETPDLVILFAGYGFAKEFRQARGHTYTIEDVTQTKRVGDKTGAATCWTCKSPDVPRLMAEMGPEAFYASKFGELEKEITHPIGCLDCHEANTMKLHISRPALREAFERQGRDIDDVSHQEMRTLVCAQCHVEYYFKGKGKYLTFPWDKGMAVENMEDYYQEYDFADWTHAISKARMIKMQHPDYEIYMTGVHAFQNVACADCHMPYRTEGGAKFTDHHLQSPLLNIANSCAVCHRWSEQEVHTRVQGIQDKVREGRDRAEDAVSKAHFDIAACMQIGADDAALKHVRQLVTQSQIRWDYVAANNGMGFHSPQECMRILMASVDLAQQARIECAKILAKNGFTGEVQYPDYSDKDTAQALIKRFIAGDPPDLLGATRTAAAR